jgi:hypothetical protein
VLLSMTSIVCLNDLALLLLLLLLLCRCSARCACPALLVAR